MTFVLGVRIPDSKLTPKHRSNQERFEVDGAKAAREFLRSHDITRPDIDTVWTAIALHPTPGIPRHMHPVVGLVTGRRRDGCKPDTTFGNVKADVLADKDSAFKRGNFCGVIRGSA